MGNIFSDKKDDKPETTRQRNRGALARNRDMNCWYFKEWLDLV
jgi:hypothetical protein